MCVSYFQIPPLELTYIKRENIFSINFIINTLFISIECNHRNYKYFKTHTS